MFIASAPECQKVFYQIRKTLLQFSLGFEDEGSINGVPVTKKLVSCLYKNNIKKNNNNNGYISNNNINCKINSYI